MKKIALFSLVCCLCGVYAVPALATDTCGTKILHLDWNQAPNHDEFLYVNKQAQTRAQKDYDAKGNDKKNMTDGQYNLNPESLVFECDEDQCANRTVVYIPNNKGIAETKIGGYFRCSTSSHDDLWNKVDECNDGEKVEDFTETIYSVVNDTKYNKIQPKYLFKGNNQRACFCRDKKEVIVENGIKVCRTKGSTGHTPTKEQCTEGGKLYAIGDTIKDDENCKNLDNQLLKTGKTCKKICYKTPKGVAGVWGIKECPEGATQIKMTDTAARGYDPKFELYIECKTPCPDCGKKVTQNNPNKPGFCEERKQWPKRYACCLAGKDTVWKGDDLSDNGTCECVDTNKTWDAEKKQCVEKQQTPATAQCTYTVSGTIKCPNGTIKTLENEYVTVSVPCEGKTDKNISLDNQDVQSAVKGLNDKVREKLLAKCNETTTVAIVPVAQQQSGPTGEQIESAKSTLAAFTGRAEKEASVWKDAEGNFNKARLASDLTAGVVLGTVGGVVSGVVIKKNQKKKGFEALNCSVGGQKVADWGDSFQVSYRR